MWNGQNDESIRAKKKKGYESPLETEVNLASGIGTGIAITFAGSLRH
jgi:hypothetical protein